jgi:hypothetical protein
MQDPNQKPEERPAKRSWWETLFGLNQDPTPSVTPPRTDNVTTPPGFRNVDGKPADKSDAGRNDSPATAGGDTSGKPGAPQPYRPPQPEPEQPLTPHSFGPRMQLLSNARVPRVLISPEAYKRMQLYIELAAKEVGWLGTVTRLENGDFFIDQSFLLEQEVTPTETELSVEGQNKLVNELLVRGDEGLELVNRMRFWGHSHVRMGTSPSGTDERTMERWQSEGLPWAVRGIFNKLGRAEFTIYLYEDGYRICDAAWAVFDPVAQRIMLDRPRGYMGGAGYQGGYHGGSSYGGYGGGSYGGGFRSSMFGSGAGGGPRLTVPAALQPSLELRNEVSVEFAAKVSERLLFSGWFRKDRQDGGDEWAPGYHDGAEPAGDGAPANVPNDDRDPRNGQVRHVPPVRGGQKPPYGNGGGWKAAEPREPGWSLWLWLTTGYGYAAEAEAAKKAAEAAAAAKRNAPTQPPAHTPVDKKRPNRDGAARLDSPDEPGTTRGASDDSEKK